MTLARAIMDARPRVVAALAVQLRDLDIAEDAFAEAAARCLVLVEPPRDPAAWLFTTARRESLDVLRRRSAEARAIEAASLLNDPEVTGMGEIIELPEPIPDERLRLIFICCHPALALEARSALALKVICGLTVAHIAELFVTSEATMYQRITRAKRKVAEAGIAFELPERKLWSERVGAVLLTLELAYTAAYQDAAGERDGALSEEVARLAAMVAELLPHEPEALGLAALVWLARSRENARIGNGGAMIPLSRQDPARWDLGAVHQARRWLDSAAQAQRTGPYQVMAAIHLAHARRAFDGRTDWATILRLYDVLLKMRPDPLTALNRAVALAQIEGPEAGLKAIENTDWARLSNSRPFHAARAELLAASGRNAEALGALDQALALDPPCAERLFLQEKRAALSIG